MDVSAGCSNGRGEEHAVGTEIERSVRSGPAWVGRPNFAKSFLVLAKLTPLRSLHMSTGGRRMVVDQRDLRNTWRRLFFEVVVSKPEKGG